MSKSNTLSLLELFNGEKCHIYSANGELKAEGVFTASDSTIGSFSQVVGGAFPEEKDEDCEMISIKIKNTDRELSHNRYSIMTIRKDDDGNYYKVNILCTDWQINGTSLHNKMNFHDVVIEQVNEYEFDQFSKMHYKFDWSNIKTIHCANGTEKEDAFEDLCIELLNTWEVTDLKRIGKGVDRGRDATYLFKDCKIPLINATSFWVVQCKYSVSGQALEIGDIYKEMIKVIMHKPDHYLLITNRKIKSDFLDWIENEIFKGTDYYIPFKVHLIQREQLEEILSKPEYRRIMQKYFN